MGEVPSGVHLIDGNLFQTVLEQARSSPRRRMNYNFHTSMEDNPHRFLNVMLRGTYITPHRHLRPPKAESFLILEGKIAFFLFEDDGQIRDCKILGAGAAAGIDIAPGNWHTLVVLSEHAICFEVKPGPYRVSDDKEFAPWAPAEGEAGTAEYLRKLEELAEA